MYLRIILFFFKYILSLSLIFYFHYTLIIFSEFFVFIHFKQLFNANKLYLKFPLYLGLRLNLCT